MTVGIIFTVLIEVGRLLPHCLTAGGTTPCLGTLTVKVGGPSEKLHVFFPFYFLAVDAIQAAASSSHHLDFSAMLHCTLRYELK